MKRILISLVTLALLAVVALQLVSLQEGNAIATADAINEIAEANQPREVPTPSRPATEPTPPSPPVLFAEPPNISTPPEPFAPPDVSSDSQKKTIKRTIKVPRTVYEDRVVEVTVEPGGLTELQHRYSALMLRRAERMSEEDLKAAVEEVEEELTQQDEAADAEIQKAIDILKKLTDESTGTPAADRAKRALPVLDGTEPMPGQYIPAGGAPTYYSDPSAIQFHQPQPSSYQPAAGSAPEPAGEERF